MSVPTMSEINEARALANHYLAKFQNTDLLPHLRDSARAEYEQRIEVVEEMLRSYHREVDWAANSMMKALQ